MIPFALHTAASPEEALGRLADEPGAALLAGGTTLVDLMKLEVLRPSAVIDISRIGLDAIERTPRGWRIGALARNRDVAAHPRIAADLPLLSQAILQGASGALRTMATVGGNLLQRTRCGYFRDRTAACNKRSPGAGCAALDGVNRGHAVLGVSDACIATHPGDLAVALAALDARVTLRSRDGERTVAFTDFNLVPGNTPERETVMMPSEMVTAVEVPDLGYARRSLYRKVRDRASYQFALVSCAVALDVEEGVVRAARIALGGVGTKPWRAREAERSLVGRFADAHAFGDAAARALAGARPRPDNAFKVAMAERVLARCLLDLREMAL
ncbi:xanthine dehydrogenase family protein subunit M [Amycolatopsis minnesotensis]|uniref:Xanthine dehydrogenase family protein subunit M n=1 Tax=Amycolatopsis minnesotensis TaxID=337894 RepID=A0ABP5DWE4_9PSEU